jgi:outer membrane PBP1 activator LpoA protein
MNRGLGILFLLGSAVLAGCAVPTPQVETATTPAEQAENAQAAEQFRAAAELWEQAAALATPTLRNEYLLRASENWFAAGDTAAAEDLLGQLDAPRLEAPARSRYGLLRAELALMRADAEEAALYLDIARDGLAATQRNRFRSLQDSVGRLRAEPASAVLARISAMLAAIDPADPEQWLGVLKGLDPVSSGMLELAASSAPPDSSAGSWAELAWRLRRGLVQQTRPELASLKWARDFPGHAVSRRGFVSLAHSYGLLYPAPRNVAILLPTRGGLASAGLAIRDGLLAAYLENPGHSSLHFYESSDSPTEAIAAYQQAVAEGADWVIGPVRRESVQGLVSSPARTTPVLVLNDSGPASGPETPVDVFSLSLSQEDEARAIAARMLESGVQRVITLASANAWGIRMERAFTEAFEAGGGSVKELARFPVSISDHSALLTRVLQIEQSRERKDRLQSLLGQTLAFEPHRRNDFDAFFLSAGPEQARQLRPQLRFFEAGDKPVFAMSRVYSGAPDPAMDRDLNGIILPLTLAQLEASEAGRQPEPERIRASSLVSLHALGADAWNLLPLLPLLQMDPDLAFAGQTGALRMAERGKLARGPAWAVFSGGRPIPMQWPTATE